MKKWLLIYFVLCLFTISKAQNNLVPNWSFEDIQNFPPACINVGNETITYANSWMNPNMATPSLYNSIDTINCTSSIPCAFYGVPSNISGWQQPHSGKGYADIQPYGVAQNDTGGREYIQTKLIDSLRKNKNYCMSFYISLEDSSSNYATSRVGCYISSNSVSNFSQDLIDVTPQIENPYNHALTDKINWILIQGIYSATGGESYITIGNFYSDSNTDTVFVSGIATYYAGNGYKFSVYYVDDVSLVEYNSAYAGDDTSICKGLKLPLGTTTNFGATYNWSILNGSANSIDSINASHVIVTPTITTTYVLQKQQCGIFTYDTVTVYIKPTYTANAGADASICIGDSVLIGTAALCNWCSYNWQNVQAPYQNLPQLTVYPLANTTYMLSLKDSCFTTYSDVTVNVAYCQSPVVSVPNIFSPNADGINDTWQLIVSSGELSILNYSCTIYDRWGAKVFDSSTPLGMTNNGWDGHTTSGLAATEGTYYYVINYTDAKTNEQKSLKGFLELVR